MSVAVKKLQGVQSVNVSLNKGLVTIDLSAGNHLTMQELRRIITSNGFSPKEATVIVDGVLNDRSGTPTLRVDGTDETLALIPLSQDVNGLTAERAHVEVAGRVDPSNGAERLAVTSIKRLR